MSRAEAIRTARIFRLKVTRVSISAYENNKTNQRTHVSIRSGRHRVPVTQEQHSLKLSRLLSYNGFIVTSALQLFYCPHTSLQFRNNTRGGAILTPYFSYVSRVMRSRLKNFAENLVRSFRKVFLDNFFPPR
jgi:hypothetical protein